MEVGCAASIITIVISACDVARKIKDLIQSVKKHDEKMKDLEDKLDEIKMVLDGANEAYGQNESQSYSTLEQRIRKTIEKVVVRCNDDLKQFETKLEGFVARGNWAAVAWKEKTITPALDDIGKKLSDRQQRLHMLVQLLQGLELRKMISILRDFLPDEARPGASSDDTDSMEREVTSLIEAAVPADDPESGTTSQNPELLKSKEYGRSLLKAIEVGDQTTFDSLLSNGETSLVEKDAKERTPVLLAASLDKASMVKTLLDRGTEKENQREIDFTATDNVGRTLLHYCAEFGLDTEAGILLDNDVSIDARDHVGHPPAYYAVKTRQLKVLQLLLKKGASTDFDRATPEGTSHQIDQLLRASENERSALESSPG